MYRTHLPILLVMMTVLSLGLVGGLLAYTATGRIDAFFVAFSFAAAFFTHLSVYFIRPIAASTRLQSAFSAAKNTRLDLKTTFNLKDGDLFIYARSVWENDIIRFYVLLSTFVAHTTEFEVTATNNTLWAFVIAIIVGGIQTVGILQDRMASAGPSPNQEFLMVAAASATTVFAFTRVYVPLLQQALRNRALLLTAPGS